MKTAIDLKKLAQANKLTHGWMARLKFKKPMIFKFVKMVADLDPVLFDKLSIEEKNGLIADASLITYAMEIENQMIEENFHYIKYVAKKLRVRNFGDDHLSYGMAGMRKSIYYYTRDDIKFSTYCFYCIKTSFKHLYYFSKPKKTRANNAILATDMRHDKQTAKMEDLAVYTCEFDCEDEDTEMLDSSAVIDDLSKEAGLDDLQVKLIRAFLTKQSVSNWLELFMKEHNLSCTRQALYAKLKRNIQRLKDAYDRRGNK